MRYISALLLLLYALAPTFSQGQVNWFKKTYPVTAGNVASADFNGDGYPDLLVYNSGVTRVMLNKGDGTFDAAHASSAIPLSNVAFLDFNRDGKIDVAGCDGAGNFLILTGNGDGTLTVTQSFADNCSWVAVSDFNKDGDPDVAVGAPSQSADGTGNQVIVYLGDGKGGIASQVVNANVDFGANDGDPCFLNGSGVATDFDGDKIADIAFAASCTAGIFADSAFIVGKGNGTGHFTFHKDIDYEWSAPTNLRMADLNQDGRPDLFAMVEQDFPFANAGHAIGVFMSNGDGTFTFNTPIGTNISFGLGDYITSTAIADVDGDGFKDIIMGIHSETESDDGTFSETHSLWIFRGSADGSYPQKLITSLANPVGDIAWGDFDRNSRVDLALIRPATTDVWLNVTASSIFCGVNGLRVMNFCETPNGPGVFHFVSTTLDNLPVNAIQIYVDGVVKFVTLDDVLNVNLAIPDGQHRVTVKAWDDHGPFSATTFVTSCPNTTNRTVRICSPGNGMTIDNLGTTHLLASAATNLKFNVLQLYIDGSLARDDLSQTIDLPLAMGKGTHRLTVKAWDSGGQFSSSVIVNVR